MKSNNCFSGMRPARKKELFCEKFFLFPKQKQIPPSPFDGNPLHQSLPLALSPPQEEKVRLRGILKAI
jgi:hypothetical protein